MKPRLDTDKSFDRSNNLFHTCLSDELVIHTFALTHVQFKETPLPWLGKPRLTVYCCVLTLEKPLTGSHTHSLPAPG